MSSGDPKASSQRLTGKRGTANRLRVDSVILKGGFVVFGTPVEPEHFTREQIAEAIAIAKLL